MAQRSKQDQILNTAGRLFMQHGYRKISMDAIAAAVPVSKPTLYNHFSDKKSLFAAVIAARCKAMLGEIRASMDETDSVEAALKSLANIFLGLLLSTEALKINRVMIAECIDFPEMAEMFYASGPRQTHAMLTRYLSGLHRQKQLRVPDAGRSADMFLSMLRGYTHLQCLLGLKKAVSKKEREQIVGYAVKMFMRAHAL